MKKIILISFLPILVTSCASKTVVTEIKKNDPISIPISQNAIVLETKTISGKELYENTCGNCHQFYATTDFSKTDWKSILNQMQKRAKLNDSEIESIYSFITTNLK